MRDGVRLSARLWIPEGPSPAVLEYIPYRKRDRYRAIDDVWGPALATRGIAYARVDVRGTGESEGVITDEYSEAELDDGVEIIAWLAAQSWCTGTVGMRGLSWGGINTLQIAARNPPALKAIMPMACCDNRFTDDAHYVGGALGHANFQWGLLFKLVMAGPPDPAIVGEAWETTWRERLAAAPAILQTWLSHQRYDSYWQRGSVAVDLAAIRCPVYVVAGWDDTYSNVIGRLLETLSVPRKALIGPWGHTYPWAARPLGLDWIGEEVRWWDHWLNGVETGIMREPMLQAYMPYETSAQALPSAPRGRWIAEAHWPPASVATRSLHLAEGALSATPSPVSKHAPVEAGAIVGLTKPEWLDRLPAEQSLDDARSVVFDSVPLADDLEILGHPTLHLRLSSDKAVAQIAARLTHVAQDGTSWLVDYVLRNLTHRDCDATPSALVPGEEYDVTLPMGFVAHRFPKGARIRLALSQGLWPLAWPAPEMATLRLSLPDCRLDLPVRPVESIPAAPPVPQIVSAPVPIDLPAAPPPHAAGGYVLHNDTPPATSEISGADVAVTRARWETSALSPGAPDSSCWTGRAITEWKRPGWDCAIEADYTLTSTPATFQLTETLLARKDGAEIFRRESVAEIPRDLL